MARVLDGATVSQNEFASLPTEFARVGKLTHRRNTIQQYRLRLKKLSLPIAIRWRALWRAG
jgi:hypothetical protein